MKPQINIQTLLNSGLDQLESEKWFGIITAEIEKHHTKEAVWHTLSQKLVAEKCTFNVHHAVFEALFPNWRISPETSPACIPDKETISSANLKKFMNELEFNTVNEFHKFTRDHYEKFWEVTIQKLGLKFRKKPTVICDISNGVTSPRWLPGAEMNITDSCFIADSSATAIITLDKNKQTKHISFAELLQLTNQICNGLISNGFKSGDAIAIAMPMNEYAVAAYLAIIKIGAIVVSIADSFSSQEMATRLDITKTKAVFTQDYIAWDNKRIPLYDKLIEANAPKAIVISTDDKSALKLRKNDINFDSFLGDNIDYESIACDPMSHCNILFSSGTTGTPKAIPWNHSTAIKAASDAYYHQNIQPGDILAWPTNLGWMMGPWLIFAAFINKSAIALYPGAPKDREFGTFIEQAKVTMLGVVPTLVAGWKQSHCMEGLDWQSIKCFSSTGECSNPEDMFYLMWLGNYKPVIEYCGGTEIGGAYISSTVIQNNYPSLFTTPTMGSDFIIINENAKPADTGEVALIPPALGLSVQLLNTDHELTYYKGMPLLNNVVLRRHGDQLHRLQNGLYCILGRSDDTMNLGGIKISSAEIERTLVDIQPIRETAAIAIRPSRNGPSQLVIYAATDDIQSINSTDMRKQMQLRISQQLNPLFKIHDLVFVKELPKTASNKIMRKTLREEYITKYC